MVPRIHIRRPSDGSDASEVAFVGTGNEFIDASEAPRQRHPDEHFHGSQEWENGNLDERVGSWNDEAGFEMEEKKLSWDERMKWYKIYAMHFLFMWNSRTFEYVSIVLVALAFPRGLTATSIRGITSTVSSMLCASAVGNWIDRAPSRLPCLLVSIGLNHAAIIASYICWLYWPLVAGYADEVTPDQAGPFSNLTRGFLYGLILLLDVIHDLSNIANRLSVERDWIPVLVGSITPDIKYDLTQVNAVMVRIEQIVKLVAPSLLPLIMAFFTNRTEWIVLLIGVTVLLWAAEVWIARKIAAENSELRAPKKSSHDLATIEDLEVDDHFSHLKPGIRSWLMKLYCVFYRDPALRLKHFFSIPMWPASISVSLLQLTVLAYSATLITYLLEVGFSLSLITVAKATGSITGLASTVITPMAVRYMRKRQAQRALRGESNGEDEDSEGKVVRTVGMWGICTQFICLIPVVLVLWNLSPSPSSYTSTREQPTTTTTLTSPHLLITLILFAFLSLSRIGHITIQLMVQELGQVEIPLSQRSTFAGTEQSFHSLCELCHWALTVVWSRPEQFYWLALGSLCMTGVSMGIYTGWARGPVWRVGESGVQYEEIALVGVGEEDGNGHEGQDGTRRN